MSENGNTSLTKTRMTESPGRTERVREGRLADGELDNSPRRQI